MATIRKTHWSTLLLASLLWKNEGMPAFGVIKFPFVEARARRTRQLWVSIQRRTGGLPESRQRHLGFRVPSRKGPNSPLWTCG